MAGAERNELLRELVKAIRMTDFGGNLSAMGRALRMESTATLAEFVSGEKGAGMKLIDALVAYTGRTLDQIYASGGDLAKLREVAAAATRPRAHQRAVVRRPRRMARPPREGPHSPTQRA